MYIIYSIDTDGGSMEWVGNRPTLEEAVADVNEMDKQADEMYVVVEAQFIRRD